jgi:hypothetical protein
VTVTECRLRPSGGGIVGLVAGSFIEACFPATAVGFIVGIAVNLGAGIAAVAATWAVLWLIPALTAGARVDHEVANRVVSGPVWRQIRTSSDAGDGDC